MKWRIWYGDGSTYSDRDGSPFDAPTVGVQVIAQWYADGRRELCHGHDTYWWKDNEWYGGDERGWYQHLFNDRGAKALIFGTTVANGEFDRILKQAIAAE